MSHDGDNRSTLDMVIDAYKPGIDRTLIQQNLRLTAEERVNQLMDLQRQAEELQSRRNTVKTVTEFPSLLRVLADADVRFIVVGGFAATLHGSARLTRDQLIATKRATGRPRDLDALAELEIIREEHGRR